jgi:hypothetical protein
VNNLAEAADRRFGLFVVLKKNLDDDDRNAADLRPPPPVENIPLQA